METGLYIAKRLFWVIGAASLMWFLVGVWQYQDGWRAAFHAIANGSTTIEPISAVNGSIEAALSMVGISGTSLLLLGSLIGCNLFLSRRHVIRRWRVYCVTAITLVLCSFAFSALFVPITVGGKTFSVGLGSSLFANMGGWSPTWLNYIVAIGVYFLVIALLYPSTTLGSLTFAGRLQVRVIVASISFIGVYGSRGGRYLFRHIAFSSSKNTDAVETTNGDSVGYLAVAGDKRNVKGTQGTLGAYLPQMELARDSFFENSNVPNPELVAVTKREKPVRVELTSRSLPPVTILQSRDLDKADADAIAARAQAEASEIEQSLLQHGIEVIVRDIKPGPTVTVYGLEPGWGGSRGVVAPEKRRRVTVDAILAREKDLALALAVPSLRFEAPVPGASLVGIEVPNPAPSIVLLGGILERDQLAITKGDGALPVVLGKSASGDREVADLALMPHLLTAGATGSGKSMFVNSLLVSLLMQFSPQELRLLLIDPKRVELTQYNGIPHLATRVVVEPTEAVIALRGAVDEMMHRLRLLEETGSRNIDSYNSKIDSSARLAKLVIVVDEMADLMMLAPNDIEHTLCRLAQLGRATGIHLIIATQRPSVDVITGLIKANFPSRISFAVASQTDSRTILDGPGADKLLGNGDMLFLSQDLPKPKRVQGTFVSDNEIEALVEYWKTSGNVTQPLIDLDAPSTDHPEGRATDTRDSLFEEALALSRAHSRISTSLLQRRLRIGYPRAARLRDELENAGVLSRTGDVQSVEEILED